MVAVSYADLLRDALAREPFQRGILALFAELVRAQGNGPVADVGCGPGRITAHLHSIGLDPFGIDLPNPHRERLPGAARALSRPRNPSGAFPSGAGRSLEPRNDGAAGMRGGVFAQRGESEFLVLSLWRSAGDHERYLSERFPDLRRDSGATDDLDNITGDLIDLEPAWTVLA